MGESKKSVGILYGGKSVEHQISINSARNIFKYINRELFTPVLIGITKNGNWYHTDSVENTIENGDPISISLGNGAPGLFVENVKLSIDIAFPVLHGTNGEDGSVQGLLQVLDIPFVGTGVLGSSICMSKLISKQLMELSNIPTARFLSFEKDESERISYAEVSQKLGLPLMVKSANLGSSVGISKVSNEDEFKAALKDSFNFDNLIIIEEYVEGREIECAMIGNEDPIASNPGEIIISEAYEFYTFDAKYVDGDAVKIDIPAKLDPEMKENIKSECERAYKALKCEDFARVDIFLSNNGKFYLNEINTIPGFTNSSMFPMMWKDAGISFSDLITKLIGLAENRTEKQKSVETVFTSKLDK